MKRKLLISTFVTALCLLNSSLIASDQVLDEMEKHAITVVNDNFPSGILDRADEFIKAAQSELSTILIPKELKSFWKRFSNCRFPKGDIISPVPDIDKYIEFVMSAYEIGVSTEWFPFNAADGNYYCIHLETGKVGYWDFYTLCFSDNPDDQWESFFDWIERDWLPAIIRRL